MILGNKSEILKIFCDGGARGNPGPAGIGFVVKDKNNQVIFQKSEYIGRSTNNAAEYTAVIKALQWLLQNKKNFQLPIFKLQFFLDSQLVVNQLNGLYKIKNAHLKNLIIKVKNLERLIKAEITYSYIPREKNFLADKLLNQALNKALFK